jgi:surface polysaccharide O-acyltransferase-like enzyme
MEKNKLYDSTIDILRTIAIFAVLLIHTTTRTLEASSFKIQQVPWTLFLNQTGRFAVPLFFMISGYVLELNFNLHEGYFSYLKKRISRIFIPFIFWSGIYYFFVYTNHTENYFQALVGGDASYQLYFIPALLIFYLVFPLIHDFYKYIGSKWITICFISIELAFLYQDYYLQPIKIFYPIKVALFNYFVFYFGVVLANNKDKIIIFTKKWKYMLFLISLFLGIYVYYEGFSGFLTTHNYLTFYSQWRPSILIYTIGITGLLYWIFNRNTKFVSTIRHLSKLSFFVFFIHVIVLEAIWHLLLKSIFGQTHGVIAQNIWYDPFYFLTVTIISFTIAFLVHKLPYASRITG